MRALGSNLDITDAEAILKGQALINQLGLNVDGVGSAMGWAFEAYERGLLTREDTGGLDLTWGNGGAMVALLEQIAYRRGLGDLLAKGVKEAARILGRNSEEFAMQVKGQEMSGYDGRWAPGMLLSYMTSDIGAHHNRSWTITVDMAEGREAVEGRAKIVVYLQHIRPLFDTWCICRLFWGELDVSPEEIVESLNRITGWGVSVEDVLRTSEMIWNLNRCHYLERNLADGRTFDYPPARSWEDKIPSGPGKGKGVSLDQVEQMLDEYYAARGWDSRGNPTREVLEDLGLGYAADNLEKIGRLGEPIPGGIPKVRGEKYKPKAF